jgi:hypothetical protein
MKVRQKCGPCGSEVELDGEITPIEAIKEVRRWQRTHACRPADPEREHPKTGVGFAAAQVAPQRPHEAFGHIELDVRAEASAVGEGSR